MNAPPFHKLKQQKARSGQPEALPLPTDSQPGLLRFLIGHLRGQHHFLAQSVVMIMLMAIVNVPFPLLNKIAFDELIPAGEAMPLIALAALAFLVRGIASGFQVFQNYMVRRVIAGMAHSLRLRMVAAMFDASYGDFASGAVGGAVGRLNSDVQRVEELVFDSIRFVIRPICMILVMVAAMLMLNWWVTLIILTIMPLCFMIMWRTDGGLEALEKEVQEHRESLQGQVGDMLDNIRAIRCYVREERYERRLHERIDAFTRASVEHAMRDQFMRMLSDALMMLPEMVTIFLGTWLVSSGELQIGSFMALLTFQQLLRSPLGQSTWYLTQIRAKVVSARRVREICHVRCEDAQLGDGMPGGQGAITLGDVHFAYQAEQPVLCGIDLVIRPGERIAIVGPSGAGKSTLVRLLLGFHPLQAGSIEVDGVDIRKLERHALRAQIGVVFQDNPMFDGSIRDNVRLDKEGLDDAAILDAIERAEAADFLRELPEGLDTIIGTKGLKISGGQRQRLAIARVMLRNPPIVLLDEATSSLDSLSEQRIQAAFDRLLGGRTSITIAHRLSTVVAADCICYLDQGRIIESGSHQDLLARRGAYCRLFQTQVEGLL